MRHTTSETPPKEVTLFLISSLAVGGSEWKIVRIANELSRRGRPVCIAYLNGPHSLRNQVDAQVPIVCLNRKGKFSLSALLKLKTFISNLNVTKVFCVNLYPSLYVFVLRMLKLSQLADVAILINTTNFLAQKHERQMWLYRIILRRANTLIFGCIAQKQQWISSYGLDHSKCMHIYNGVDNHHFAPSASIAASSTPQEVLRDRQNCFLVGTVGRLSPVKRQEDLIKAVSEARDLGADNIEAIIVGDGPSREMLEQLVNSVSLNNAIHFSGELDDVRPVLQRIDLFVLSSATETFSNAALEAMAMGKGVILSDIDGAREMLSDGLDGRLYQCGDVSALARILFELSQDRNEVKRLGKRALEAVRERFTFEQMLDVYDHLAFGDSSLTYSLPISSPPNV